MDRSNWQAWCLVGACAVAPGASADAPDRCAAASTRSVAPLVEIYTSEGCSSCPPADRWLSQQAAHPRGANFLAFHVDYWDDLGWKDRFASPDYARRQRQRVEGAGGRIVYTPQVMLGEQTGADWRVARRFDAALAAERARSPGAALSLRLGRASDGWSATLGAAPVDSGGTAQVWLAQYADGQSSVVRAGENRGATLRHDRVVRKLWGPWPLAADPLSRVVALPPAMDGAWGVTAFVQDARGRVLQSLELPACAATSERR